MRAKNRLRREIRLSKLPSGFISARLGNNVGDVEVSGRQNYVYARLASGDVIQVYNIRVVPVNDLDVYVGYDPKEPQLLQVLSIRGSRARYGDTASNNAYQVMPHHLTHEWMQENGGTDVVFTELRQFMPLRPQADGMIVSVERGLGFVNSAWTYISGSSKDLSGAIPSTGAYFGLVYVDVNGLLELATGVLKDLGNLLPSDIPSPIPGTLPIAGVRLYGGQTGIAEARSTTDIADVRFPGTSFSSQGIAAQQPNTVWAGPSTGTASDIPTFRSLVIDDLPMAYGSMWGNEIAWAQASAVQNTWYLISDADMSDGQLNKVTHDGNGKLTVESAGRYLIVYSVCATSSVVGHHIQTGISVDGSVQNDGIAHDYPSVASQQVHTSSTAILNLSVGNYIEIAIRTTDSGTPDLGVDHLNVSILQVGK